MLPGASAFAPIPCGPGTKDIPIPWVARGTNNELPTVSPFYQTCPPPDTGNTTCYANNLYLPRYFVGNRYVRSVDLHLTSFLVHNTDAVKYGRTTGSLSSTTAGGPASGFLSLPSMSCSGGFYSLQERPGYVRVESNDDGTTDRGFEVDFARVTCSSTGSDGSHALAAQQRYTGVLLGTNDVAYFTIPAQTAQHITLAFWGDTGTSKDFDVYARCNQRPTDTAYDYISWPGAWNNNKHTEFLHITPGACTGTWHIAVASYWGEGWFNLVYSRHYADKDKTLRVGAQPMKDGNGNIIPLTYADKTRYARALQRTAWQMYGTSEGALLLKKFDLYEAPGCQVPATQGTACAGQSCDICLMEWPWPGQCTTGTQAGVCAIPSWAGICQSHVEQHAVITHELGHSQLCVGDEYDTVMQTGKGQCGHSVMAHQDQSHGNLCYLHISGLTVRTDHAKDPDPTVPVPTSEPAAWDSLWTNGRTPLKVTMTPDRFTYQNFLSDSAGSFYSYAVGEAVIH